MGYTILSLSLTICLFIRLAVVAPQICEITQNFDKIRTYGSFRSSTVIDIDANRKRICNFLLVSK